MTYPKTSDDALQVALCSEANLKQTPAKAEIAAASANTTQPTGTSEMAEAIAKAVQMAAVAATGASVGYPGRNQHFRGRERGRSRGPCYSCGQIGHYWRDAVCPNSPINRGQGNGQGAGNM